MSRLRGLRPRIALLVGAVVVVCLLVAFATVYRRTSRQLTQRIDADLRADAAALRGVVERGSARPPDVAARVRAYLAREPFRATAQVAFAVVPGQRPVSNQPELLQLGPDDTGEPPAEVRAERAAARRFLASSLGLSTRRLPEAGPVRVLVADVRRGGRLVAHVGVAEPTSPRDRAEDAVAEAFLLAGALGLAAALLGATLVASRVSAPLRHMAGVAARVDAGDLAPRMRLEGRATEIDVLATSFDHMLDRLEEAFARQAAFVADASHELRTPLTVVRGQLEVLALDERPSRDEVRRVERLVRTEVERMSRLVDDLLVLAQAGEVQFLHRSPVPLPGFLGDLVAGLRKGQRRAIVLDDVPPLVVDADSDRLAQALRNLVANAVAHAGPGGTVRVSVERSAGAVRLLVDDDGPGIAPDQRERVFDRFQRLDTGRARAEGGAGLGLAIVRAVAQAHGGRAWAEDSPLGGARFVVELPT